MLLYIKNLLLHRLECQKVSLVSHISALFKSFMRAHVVTLWFHQLLEGSVVLSRSQPTWGLLNTVVTCHLMFLFLVFLSLVAERETSSLCMCCDWSIDSQLQKNRATAAKLNNAAEHKWFFSQHWHKRSKVDGKDKSEGGCMWLLGSGYLKYFKRSDVLYFSFS